MIADGNRSKIEVLIRQHLPGSFPALSICVMHRGEVILNDAWGWLDPDSRDIAVTTDSRFDLASVSKLITHTAMLALVDSGAITLDSRLVEVVPEFGRINPRAISNGQDPHTRKHLPIEGRFHGLQVDPTGVTFRHLLTHTSGLPPWRSVYLLAVR